MLCYVLVALAAVAVRADISGQHPPAGSCLCLNADAVNIRSTACGTVIGSGNSGQCFISRGTKTQCALSGTTYQFFDLNYGSGAGWIAGDFMIVGSASQCQGGSGVFTDQCLDCICQIESNCNPNIGCIDDVGSLSCGPYQIKEPYWRDCGSIGGGWQACANDMACAETCVRNYMNRYGTYCTGGVPPVCEDYSRIHNGGPTGCQNSATDVYWDKIRACCGGQTGCD